MTRIIFENENGRYEINVFTPVITVLECWEELIHPVLLAAGYQEGSIRDLFFMDDKSFEPA